MKIPLLFGATLLLAGGLPLLAADSVELNGITCLPGEKLACFRLYQPARTQPLNFMLAEGESKFGFKLLAVDAPAHRVLMEKCGVKEYLRIGSAPELLTPAGTRPAVASVSTNPPTALDGEAVADYFASDALQRIQAGHPIMPDALASASAGAGKNTASGQNAAATGSSAEQNSGNGGSAGSAGSPGSAAGTMSGGQIASASAGQNSYAGQLWYQESLSIEQSRALTADQVLNGSLTPLPRTPLTPAGTPPQLVGQEVYFANYIPGYKVIGFLNQ